MRVSRPVHFGPVKNVIVSPDGEYVLSLGSDDGMVFESRINTMEEANDHPIGSLSSEIVLSIVVSTSYIVYTDGSNCVKKANWPTFSNIDILFSGSTEISILSASKDGIFVSLSGADTAITIIELENKTTREIYDNLSQIMWMQFSPCSKYLATYNQEGKLFIFRLDDLSIVYEESLELNKCSISWTNESYLVHARPQEVGSIIAIMPKDGKTMSVSFIEHSKSIIGLAVSQNGICASLDSSKKLVISKLDSSFQHSPLNIIQDTIASDLTVFSVCNNRLCIGDSDGNVSIIPMNMENRDDSKEEEFESSDSETDEKVRVILGQEKNSKKLKKLSSSEEEIVHFSNLDEEEDEEESNEEKPKNKSRFIQTMAEEDNNQSDSISLSDDLSDANTMSKQTPKSKEEIRKDFQEVYGGENSMSSDSGPEDADDEKSIREKVKMRKKEEELQKKRDRSFIIETDQETETEETSTEESTKTDYESDKIEEIEPNVKSFMPGSTYEFVMNRKFLCWNEFGAILLRERDEDHTSIDIEFSDKYSNKDKFIMNDHSYILATMNQTGFVAASRTYLHYQPHKPQKTIPEFSFKFPSSETIDLIAIGNGWISAITEKNRLHIFSIGGFELCTLSIPDRVLTMTGGKERLFLCWGTNLQYLVLDIKTRQKLAFGTLPAENKLLWVGFDEKDNLYIHVDNSTVMELVFDFGFHWVPVCDLSKKFNDKSKSFWVVSVGDSDVWGVYLNSEKTPQPSPLLGLIGISFDPQMLDVDAKDWILKRIEYSNAPKDKKPEFAIQQDSALFKHFANSLKSGELSKTMSIGKLLISEKAEKFALQSATKEKAFKLAASLTKFYQSRIEEEEEEQYEEEIKEIPIEIHEKYDDQHTKVVSNERNNDEPEVIHITESKEVSLSNEIPEEKKANESFDENDSILDDEDSIE